VEVVWVWWPVGVNVGASADLELVDGFCYLGDMLSVDGDGDVAVEVGIRIGWNKFRQSLIVRGRPCSSCVGGGAAWR